MISFPYLFERIHFPPFYVSSFSSICPQALLGDIPFDVILVSAIRDISPFFYLIVSHQLFPYSRLNFDQKEDHIVAALSIYKTSTSARRSRKLRRRSSFRWQILRCIRPRGSGGMRLPRE
jgi:hypothetical protein